MTDKIEKLRRGRPRAFDEADVLRRAQLLFLSRGFEAAPYEQVAESVGLSKPSLYNAFGDKEALFERALADYAAHAKAHIVASFSGSRSFAEAGKALLMAAADVYAHGDGPSTGCLLVGTALPACVQMESVRAVLAGFVEELEQALSDVIAAEYRRDAKKLGQTPDALAMLISSLLFSLAVRARMGLSRRKLRQVAGELGGLLG